MMYSYISSNVDQFCDVVEKQLYTLQTGHPLLHLVEKKLLELEETCQSWREHGGAFDHKNIPGRGGPESEPTLSMYGRERTFRCPDGQIRIFSLHVWVVRSWRIHYFPVEDKREMLIGYIGKHLHTMSDPT